MTKFSGYAACHAEYDHANRCYLPMDHTDIKVVNFTARFDSEDDAKAFVAAQPKFLRFKTWKGHAQVGFRAEFVSTGVTGDKNETGLKRVRKFLELCEVEYSDPQIINKSTLEDLRVFLEKAGA